MSSCAGCRAGKLDETIRILRRKGFRIHRELRDCANCGAELAAAEAAKESGAAGVIFWSSQTAAKVAEDIQRRSQAEKAEKAGVKLPEPPPRVILWVSHATVEGTAGAAEAFLAAAAEAGLETAWDGGDTNIAVFL